MAERPEQPPPEDRPASPIRIPIEGPGGAWTWRDYELLRTDGGASEDPGRTWRYGVRAKFRIQVILLDVAEDQLRHETRAYREEVARRRSDFMDRLEDMWRRYENSQELSRAIHRRQVARRVGEIRQLRGKVREGAFKIRKQLSCRARRVWIGKIPKSKEWRREVVERYGRETRATPS